ncbi:MAG: M23 family metallopeptidase [Clostridia bacterium]|nr:M23 family metallopeptidase [Clostridia bacterium]
MKIVRMKIKKNVNKADMFVVLCLIQSLLVIMIVLTVFIFSRINADIFNGILYDIQMIFDEDIDIGGYFTPSEEKTEEITVGSVSFVTLVETEESEVSEQSLTYNDAFDTYSSAAVMPVTGTVTSDYGSREHPIFSGESFHGGRDIAAAEGSDIYAVLDGTVTEAGRADMAGNYIKIDHGDGRETLYCHCSELYVTAGVNIRKGDVIAAVGQTGLATGPHLHFELHENGKAVDPEKILCEAQNVY